MLLIVLFREPWWHGFVADDLADHGSVGVDLVECFEREGADTFAAVTFEAVLLEDAGDAVVPGHHRGFVRGRGRAFENAAWRRGGWDGGLCVINRRIDGLAEELISGLVEGGTDGVLVINSAVVEDGAFRVEDEDIGGGGGINESGEVFVGVAGIDCFGVETGGGGELVLGFIGGDAVDEDKGDRLVGVLFGDAGECWEVFAAEWAGGAGHGDDGGGGLAEAGESVRLSVDIRELEIWDEASDLSLRGVNGLRGAAVVLGSSGGLKSVM